MVGQNSQWLLTHDYHHVFKAEARRGEEQRRFRGAAQVRDAHHPQGHAARVLMACGCGRREGPGGQRRRRPRHDVAGLTGITRLSRSGDARSRRTEWRQQKALLTAARTCGGHLGSGGGMDSVLPCRVQKANQLSSAGCNEYGVPNARQFEPDRRLAQADRHLASGRLSTCRSVFFEAAQ